MHKDKILIELVRISGATMYGFLFTLGRSRVQDLLNETRNFLPFQHLDGRSILLAKVAVSDIA